MEERLFLGGVSTEESLLLLVLLLMSLDSILSSERENVYDSIDSSSLSEVSLQSCKRFLRLELLLEVIGGGGLEEDLFLDLDFDLNLDLNLDLLNFDLDLDLDLRRRFLSEDGGGKTS